MKTWYVAAVLAFACSKKSSSPAEESKPAPPAAGPGAVAPPAAPSGNGLQVKHVIPDFTGTYDAAFAQLKPTETVIAFVRDCPKLTCEVGAWEAEQVKAVCPKAYLATLHVPGQAAGRFKLDLGFAGPADNIATGTLEAVSVELTAVGQDGVEGSVTQRTTESSVTGQFKAQVCPLT